MTFRTLCDLPHKWYLLLLPSAYNAHDTSIISDNTLDILRWYHDDIRGYHLMKLLHIYIMMSILATFQFSFFFIFFLCMFSSLIFLGRNPANFSQFWNHWPAVCFRDDTSIISGNTLDILRWYHDDIRGYHLMKLLHIYIMMSILATFQFLFFSHFLSWYV